MNAIEYTMCVIELYPTIGLASVLSFCSGMIIGFVLSSTMKKGS